MEKKRKNKKRKLNKAKVLGAIIIAILLVLMPIKIHIANKEKNNLASKEKEQIIPEDTIVSIVGIGDTLCHSQNFKDAYNQETDTYDFSPMFKNVNKYFENATIAVGNLETTLAGKERGFSGYPCFNSPDELAFDLKEMGIDILTTANNHSLDTGYKGLEATLNTLDRYEVLHTGTARSVEEQNTILFQDLKGIKTAFLNFTYGTNGIPLPTGKEYCVNLIDKDFMKKKLEQAKEEGAELICVSMHWGDEYRIKPTNEQKDLAEFLIKNGADVILGNHSHVPEPMEMKTVTLEDGSKKEGFVIYSMGNFFSAQTQEYTRDTLIVDVEIRKDGKTGKISIDKANYTPVYVYDNGLDAKDRYELLDIEKIIQDYENGASEYSEKIYNLSKSELKKIVEIVGPEIDNTIKENEKEDLAA